MVKNKVDNKLLVFSSFTIAILLFLLPLPEKIRYLKPDFVSLVLIYWLVFLPNSIGIIFAFLIGLYIDLIMHNLLGTMGLSFAIMAYLTNLFSNRLLIFRFWQHSLIILILIGVSQIVVLWIYIIIGRQPYNFTYWVTSLSSVLMWPVVYYSLDYSRTRFKF